MAIKKKKKKDFLKAVQAQAEEQRKIILDNNTAVKNEAINEAENKYEAEAKKYINRQLSIIESEIKSEYAIRDLNSKGELFRTRDRMVNDIFASAKEKLLTFTQSKDYKDFILKSAQEIADIFKDNKCILYLKKDDIEYKSEIEKLFNGNAAVETDTIIRIGGIKGYCETLNIYADNTLDSKLDDEKTNFTEKAVLKIF